MNTRSERGILFDVQRFCLHDGPGIRTTVFFKGCPLNCAWCHNPESKSPLPELSFHRESCIGCGECKKACTHENCVHCFACAGACPSGARTKIGYEATVDEVIATALRDRPFYGQAGGVTISGGEPFMQPAFLLAVLEAAKEHGLHTAIETSGAAKESDLLAAAAYTDLFLFDIKGIPGETHRRYVGCDGQSLHDNLRLLDAHGARSVLRCPIVPGVQDNAAHFAYLACLAKELRHVTEIDIEPYHTAGLAKAKDLGRTDIFTVENYDKAAFRGKIEREFLPLLADVGVPVSLY